MKSKLMEPPPPSAGSAPSPIPAEIVVGRRLRLLRRSRGLSQRMLAERCGLNINTLSMIENGKTSPSVSTLQVLAQVFGVPISQFFEDAPARKRVVFHAHNQGVASCLPGASLEDLGTDLAGSAVQPYIAHLGPGASGGKARVMHAGHEFIFCLSGELRCEIDQDHFVLGPGDSLLFESGLPHRWHNQGPAEACLLLVFYPSSPGEPPSQVHFS